MSDAKAQGSSTRSDFEKNAPRRFGAVIKLKPGMYDQYTRLHDRTWDQVLKRMADSNMRNFVVYYHKEMSLLFHHWEYVGTDLEKDMAAVAADPVTKKWWTFCEPCQQPFQWSGKPPSQGGNGDKEGDSWWSPMTEVAHCGMWPTSWSNTYPDPNFVRKNPEAKLTSETETEGLISNAPKEEAKE